MCVFNKILIDVPWRGKGLHSWLSSRLAGKINFNRFLNYRISLEYLASHQRGDMWHQLSPSFLCFSPEHNYFFFIFQTKSPGNIVRVFLKDNKELLSGVKEAGQWNISILLLSAAHRSITSKPVLSGGQLVSPKVMEKTDIRDWSPVSQWSVHSYATTIAFTFPTVLVMTWSSLVFWLWDV